MRADFSADFENILCRWRLFITTDSITCSPIGQPLSISLLRVVIYKTICFSFDSGACKIIKRAPNAVSGRVKIVTDDSSILKWFLASTWRSSRWRSAVSYTFSSRPRYYRFEHVNDTRSSMTDSQMKPMTLQLFKYGISKSVYEARHGCRGRTLSEIIPRTATRETLETILVLFVGVAGIISCAETIFRSESVHLLNLSKLYCARSLSYPTWKFVFRS